MSPVADTLERMNPQVPGYPTGLGTSPAQVPMAAPVLPPPAPVPFPMPGRQPRRTGRIVAWLMVAFVVLLALSAITVGVIRMSAAPPAGTTATVSPPPPSSPTYSPEQIAAAKKEACDASDAASASINTAQGTYLSAASDRQSPQYGPALANFQTVVAVEIKYMKQHLSAATPQDVVQGTNDYITALLALADAHTRGLSIHEAQPFVEAARQVGNRLDKACE